jgi:hypothetical protein
MRVNKFVKDTLGLPHDILVSGMPVRCGFVPIVTSEPNREGHSGFQRVTFEQCVAHGAARIDAGCAAPCPLAGQFI